MNGQDESSTEQREPIETSIGRTSRVEQPEVTLSGHNPVVIEKVINVFILQIG